MKIQTTLLCGLLLSTPVFAAPINNKSSINQQVGYSFGYLMGRSNAESIQDLDLDAFVQGLREASKGQAASLSDEEMARVLTQYKRQAEAKQLLEVKQLADKNAKIGAAFLAENAKKPEVKPRLQACNIWFYNKAKASHLRPIAKSKSIMKDV